MRAIRWSGHFTLAVGGCRGRVGLHGVEHLLGRLRCCDRLSGEIPFERATYFFEQNLIMFFNSIFRRGLSGMDCVILLLRFLFTTNTATTSSTCPKDPAFLGSDICNYASFLSQSIIVCAN